MSFAYRSGNGEAISEDDFTDDEEEEKESYQNALEAVRQPPRRIAPPSTRADIDYNDMEEDEDSGDYEELPDMDEVATPHRSALSSHSTSAHGPSSSSSSSLFRRTSSLSATSFASGNSADDDDDYPTNNNRNQGRRFSNGLPVSGGGRVVSGSGVRRQSAGGNGGVVIEDGLNTAKIVNVKSNLRPVASKLFDNSNNKAQGSVGPGQPRMPSAVPKPVNGGGGRFVGSSTSSFGAAAAAEKRPAENNSRSLNVASKTTASTTTTSEVGSGQNSVRIKGQISRLRSIAPKNDCDDNELTNCQSEPSARDVQKTAPSAKKIPPVGSAAKQTSVFSGAHRSQPWNQTPPSPPPPPFPSPPPSPPPAFPHPSPPAVKKTPTVNSAARNASSSGSSQWSKHQVTKRSSSPPVSPSPPSSCSWSPSPNPATSNNRSNPRQTTQRQDQPWKRDPRSDDDHSERAVNRNFDRTQSQQPTQATKNSHAPAPKALVGRSGSANTRNGYDNVDLNGRTSERVDSDGAWQDRTISLSCQNWYFGELERDQCEKKLDRLINEDGSYLVRNSQRGGEENPYSLSIVFKRHVYHLNIRLRPDGKFSIGKAKPDEKVFNSVLEMVTFHSNNAIELIGDFQKKTPSGKVTLNRCPTKY